MKALKKALLGLSVGVVVMMTAMSSAFAYPPFYTVVEWLLECQAGNQTSCVKVDRYGTYYGINRHTDPSTLPLDDMP
ncbi:hypothetical protein H8K35_10240 [Undibacterium sp. LX40W]|uniref:Uncharacterized protein n=1 Tax=Undibacterium nitidum TaxID=2762298 RepID=A0A923HMV0_9BURK|nr:MULTISPECIES: hypothetical protein [Undibacterium]MBC3881967.1 hypothetical protein [Undibacterium nitidum]MBC3892037.1 hypothetical protein [Undibacterium sp. LX40W]